MTRTTTVFIFFFLSLLTVVAPVFLSRQIISITLLCCESNANWNRYWKNYKGLSDNCGLSPDSASSTCGWAAPSIAMAGNVSVSKTKRLQLRAHCTSRDRNPTDSVTTSCLCTRFKRKFLPIEMADFQCLKPFWSLWLISGSTTLESN